MTATIPPLLVIVGPTASGKTELALRLGEALNGEILSADSVQIYRHFDIGSGKPSATELRQIPHHFIDTHDPLEELDAAGWAALAEAKLAEITARGRQPIVCGGSFLWVRALLFGLVPAPAADPTIRAEHLRIAESLGRAELHQRLAIVDPVIAQKLAPNDFVRVSRALEVFELTGVQMSHWQAEHGFRDPKRPYCLLGVRREREELYARIHTRAAQMLASGLVSEVVGLCQRGYGQARAMSSVGYREVFHAVMACTGGVSPSSVATDLVALSNNANDAVATHSVDEATLLEAIAQKTRVFSRRQRTWLREEPVSWLEPEMLCDETALLAAVRAAAVQGQ